MTTGRDEEAAGVGDSVEPQGHALVPPHGAATPFLADVGQSVCGVAGVGPSQGRSPATSPAHRRDTGTQTPQHASVAGTEPPSPASTSQPAAQGVGEATTPSSIGDPANGLRLLKVHGSREPSMQGEGKLDDDLEVSKRKLLMQPVSMANNPNELEFGNHSVKEDLLAACGATAHSQAEAQFCVRALAANRDLAQAIGPAGEQPLHALCMAQEHTRHSVEICQALLKAHGQTAMARWKTKSTDKQSSLPLHLLCRQPRPTSHSAEICRLLLTGHEQSAFVTSGGRLACSLVVEDHPTLSEVHVAMFKRLVEANKDSVKQKDSQNQTLLHRLCLSTNDYAHSENVVECMRIVLDTNKRLVDADDVSERKPIHLLCMSSCLNEHSVAICDLIMSLSSESICCPDCEGMMPIHHLFKSPMLTGSTTVIFRKFCENNPRSAIATDTDGTSPLHLLCKSSILNSTTVLLARQILIGNKTAAEQSDKSGMLPIHCFCASMGGNRTGLENTEELYEMLLDANPAGLTTADHKGRLPLHWLCEAGFTSDHAINMLERMLEQSEDALVAKDSDGRLPMHLLCESKFHTQLTYDAFQRLQKGSKENMAAIQTVDGLLPLHCLCTAGKHSVYSVDIFRALIQAFPAGISGFDTGGQVPIHKLCAAAGHTIQTQEIFSELLDSLEKIGKSGADLMTVDGWHPLHIICGSGNHTENTYWIFSHLLQLNPGGCLFATSREQQLPLHLLLEAPHHSRFSIKMCQDLIKGSENSLKKRDSLDQVPLEALCSSQVLTASSLDVCHLIAEVMGREYQWMSALTKLCENPVINHYTVGICEILLRKMKQYHVHFSKGYWPLHALCGTTAHNKHTVEICTLILAEYPEFASVHDNDGWLPLHILCHHRGHDSSSVRICDGLLRVNPDSCNMTGELGVMPLHVLVCNSLHTNASVKICELLLKDQGKNSACARNDDGALPLHLMCSSTTLTEFSVRICELLLQEYPDAAWTTAKPDDKDLALHKLCFATPHTAHSVKIGHLLLHTHPSAVSVTGNHHDPEKLHQWKTKGIEDDGEPGDEPLLILCQSDSMTQYTAALCKLVYSEDLNTDPALSILSQKIYRPHGDEDKQKLALRALIALAVGSYEAATYLQLDQDISNGPQDVRFLKSVEREMGFDSENPLLHILCMARLYRNAADLAATGVLANKLNTSSQECLAWANAMVDALPTRIAKKAIWTPERYSRRFMRGSSPFGIALELGDLRLASCPPVWDVVRNAWPGKYKWDFNPTNGNVFNNLFLDFEIEKHSNTRKVLWKWHERFLELLDPSIFLSSPMNMYFLMVMMQTTLVVMFQVVLDLSHHERKCGGSPCFWSYGLEELYVIVHVGGGAVYELGQLLEDGLMDYLQDAWNCIDIAMYSSMGWWFLSRIEDWNKHQTPYAEMTEAERERWTHFVPDNYASSQILGLAGIFIWIRILNVFGLDPYFGPLVRIMQGMTLGVLTFIVLLAIFIMGFSSSLRTIFTTLDSSDAKVQQHGYDVLIEDFKDPIMSMVTLLNMALGQFDLLSLYQVSKTALMVVCLFLVCTFIMLLNLLIALMTDTYSEIRLESEQLWKKDRALLMASYTTTETMLDNFNLGQLLTTLPQPLNLVVLLCWALAFPFYHFFQRTVHTKTWERKANDLRVIVMKIVIWIVVCLPSALIFVCVALPLNWIFIVSAGTLDYLGSKLFMRNPARRVLFSRIIGLVGTPFFFLYYSLNGAKFLVLHLLGPRKPNVDKHSDVFPADDSSHLSETVNGEAFGSPVPDRPSRVKGIYRIGLSGSKFGTLTEKTKEPGHKFRPGLEAAGGPRLESNYDHDLFDDHDHDHIDHFPVPQSKEIWEADLEEDDILVLQDVFMMTKPLDAEEAEAAAALAQQEKDAAVHELRLEMSKLFSKVEKKQRATMDLVRDFQLESKKFSHDTSRIISSLNENTKRGIADVAAHSTKNQHELLELTQHHADLASKRLAEHDEKINLLVSAVCGPIGSRQDSNAPSEIADGGLLLAAINRRIERLEQQEFSMLQNILKQGAEGTREKLGDVSQTIMTKVQHIEDSIPKLLDKIQTRFEEVEQKSWQQIEAFGNRLGDIDKRLKNSDRSFGSELKGSQRLTSVASSVATGTKDDLSEAISRALDVCAQPKSARMLDCKIFCCSQFY